MSQLCLSKVILKQSAEVLGFISLFGDFSGAVFPFLAGCSITGKSISPRHITRGVTTSDETGGLITRGRSSISACLYDGCKTSTSS